MGGFKSPRDSSLKSLAMSRPSDLPILSSVSATPLNRRSALLAGCAVAGAALTPQLAFANAAFEPPADVSLKGRIKKTLKIGMVNVKGSLTDKFKAVKTAGFDGIELNAPGVKLEETLKAIEESGLPVDGTVNSTHWQVRHTDPKAEVREKALKSLTGAIEVTAKLGGDTCLLVIGHGKDGDKATIRQRALDNIRLALPVAEKHNIVIAIENVWNHFLYDHDGGSDQSAQEFVEFVDELNSPLVAMQFDIGNHWKYGSMGDWIRQLNKRIYKLDLKGFSREKNKFTKIGEGDLDWADVRLALKEIDYNGWAAAEVGGGDSPRLKEVSANMDVAFGLV